jgi:tetratricopeptide (TPR) repeat protein
VIAHARGAGIAGRYTLVDVLGEGGMGTVYRVNQSEPVKRQVALKLIKRGMDSKAVLARFDAERQALALMDHPNIARVYDGGTTPTGQPFFVMELVDGIAITKYCDQKRLPLRSRLELFVQVCQAVQHAHQKGIIHRDLKPGNVLVTEVDGRPAPKVIDFGVAKATEQKLTDMSFAETGVVVGTPAYMSPEQADPESMDIDTRTDVYALGVILYELLVGSPPIDAKQFKRGAMSEMLRMVREVDPPRPSTRLSTAEDLPNIAANRNTEPAKLTKSLRGELDWVVMKAVEKDRGRRYETVNGLARDLERYLSDEVVEARPPSAGYRLKKFVRRHKGEVIAAALVFLALVAGVIGTSLGMVEARRQKRFAEQGWNRAKTEQTRAEQNFATARALVLSMGNQFNRIEASQKNPKLTDLARKEALDAARKQFDQFRTGQPDDESVLWQSSLLHRYTANISRTLSDFQAATAAYTESIRIQEDLAARFPQKAYGFELALTLSDRAMLEKRMGKLKDAAATLDRALKFAEKPRGANSASTATRTLGMTEADRANLAYNRGLFEDAARFAARGRELLDELAKAPFNERLATDPLFAAIATNTIAIARRELGQTEEALAAHDDVVARIKALAGPQANRDLLYWVCEGRRERAKTAAAIPAQRESAAADLAEIRPVAEKLVEDYPQVAFYREKLAAIHLQRGELLALLGQQEPAMAELTKSLAVSRELIDRLGVLSASLLVRGHTFLAIGRVRAAAGKNDDAVTNWKNAAKVFEIALGIDPDNFHHRRGKSDAEQALKAVDK